MFQKHCSKMSLNKVPHFISVSNCLGMLKQISGIRLIHNNNDNYISSRQSFRRPTYWHGIA